MLTKIVAALEQFKQDLGAIRRDVNSLKNVKPIVKNGKDGRDAPPLEDIVAAVLAEIPEPDKIEVPSKEELVAEVLAKIPKPRDGRDGQTVSVSDVAAIVLAKLPKPKDGRDAPDLETVAKRVRLMVQDGRDGAPGAPGKKGDPGKDGVSITDVKLEDNALYVWLDGVKKLAGRIRLPVPSAPFNPGGGGGSIRSAIETFKGLVIVTEPSQLSGTLRSDVVYVLDQEVNFTGTGLSIEVPPGGLNIRGHSSDVSGLVNHDDNATLFVSPPGGSGNLTLLSVFVEVDGTGSKVYDVQDVDGTHALEVERVTYRNCASLGEATDYRQGLETNVARFGGRPSLTLAGAWNGFRADTSLVRNIDDAMTEALFVAGAGFVMSNRFITDINADLGATAPLLDFVPANFPNSSTLRLVDTTITRNGVSDPTDLTLTPNISPGSLASFWKGNVGIGNTFVGGRLEITTAVQTTITTIATPVDIAGTFTPSILQHFSAAPSQNNLRHDGNVPREFWIDVDMRITGTSGEELQLNVLKWDDSESQFEIVDTQIRVVVNVVTQPDFASFIDRVVVQLDEGDYVKLQVANNSSTANVTAQLGGRLTISER